MTTDTEKEAIVLLTQLENDLLDRLTEITRGCPVDPRWLSIARTHFEQGAMAARRAVRAGKRTDE
jgi:hypothetical protein